ncbi:FtsK/SpoIIIE domain-containing protein [Blastococcus sp. SYSU DS1021]
MDDAAASVIRLANAAAGVNDAYRRTALRDADVARWEAAAVREERERQLHEAAQERCTGVIRQLDAVVAGLAPGVLSCGWDDLAAVGRPAGILDAAAFVRCGTLRAPAAGPGAVPAIPLLLPLLDHGNVLITAPGDHAGVDGLVQEITLRALLGTGAGQLSLTTYDPHLRATTAPFTALRQVDDELVPPTLASPEELRTLLEELSRDVRRVSEMYEGVPTTLGAFRRAARQPIERYRLVVLLDYPSGFDHRSDGLLRTLLRTGPACGISFVLHHDTTARAEEVEPEQLYPLASVVRLGQPSTVDGYDGFSAEVGLAPSLAIIEPAIATLQARAKDAAAPRISFGELHPDPAAYWRESSAERVTAVIGRAGHQPVEVTLGDEREQRHNVLVSGAVGQGKSNLLMVLVHSWAVRYAPAELCLYLLDFKDGVTLYPLAPQAGQEGWLPHAGVLGLESDRAFGAAVLRHLVGEFERRASVIRPHGDNITRYRQAQPAAHMPRIIVVIDEFHVLFEEDDELTRSALLDLERLAKKGRAYGIHLVLASQTLSGITAMLSKQDGIFAQFPTRLALKNSAAESRAVLDQQNTEAAKLRYRGEVVVNTDFGQVDGNRRAVVALAEPTELAELRTRLWRQAGDLPPPRVFHGAAAADLLAVTTSTSADQASHPSALLGLPVSVAPDPLRVPFPPDSGRHLSIVGAGDTAAGGGYSAGAAMLQTAAVSLGMAHPPGEARFVVLDLLPPASRDRAIVTWLSGALAASGHTAEVQSADSLVGTLRAMAETLPGRRAGAPATPTYLVAFGMDRAPNLRTFDLATGGAPIEALHSLWREGPQLGVHLLGWWANVRAYTDQLGLEAGGMVDTLAVLRVSPQDVLDLFGPFVSWTGPSNRALVRDVAQAGQPTVVVPFAPVTDEDIARLGRRGAHA